ncbi:beta-galactosidase/beta-glucuronidase [Aspergillus japonicus CBS 114.51]|uniref:Beta-mannosidase B n=1 Tax=Aspergillus japonicus CBS 114.51 TaxID=1448312 RepID=A0A8T8WQ67_ASPJA|nr:beta-galactosidase/beta-glucuronidase [Aspergillus japonicus CBS 114.51]RAH77732.1 beta-galactosidase/beta-glucuronidase [Aspergillus japonicus CBS 114.51]
MASFIQHPLTTGWSFKDSNEPASDAWMSVSSVPSVVHQDLQANGRLQDPYIGFNELEARWVNEKSWSYRNVFQKPTVPAGSRVVLAFDGLDTFATVRLDDKIILESNNMFLAHRVDVTEALEAEGDHVLLIDFDCAMLRAKELREQDPKHNWASFNGDPARLAVRKAQYHWGWDWGPVLMTAGIWRDIRLEVYSARIADLWTDVDLAADHQHARVDAYAEIDVTEDSSFRAIFIFSKDGKEVARQVTTPDNKVAKVTFDINQPSLWWPNGYGDPNLYEVSVFLEKDQIELHHVSKKIGIRTAEVVQRPDKHGKSFFFRINGVDVFCGGSCWIPADNLLPSITRERYRSWIELMVAGRQVMIRVWGGGIYEDNNFYEACDELGVLVWQDFMFGCGNYPTWPELLESIEREAVYNVRRLRHHPSIVLYAGNNEDYQVQESAGLTYDFEDKNPENWLKTDFPARYIYEKLLPEVMDKHSPRTFYHPGSPWGDGKKTSDPTVGDMHQWNVWHGTQEKYQIFDTLGGRFNSEFGMEAFPHLSTINHFVEHEKDKYPQSHVLDFHNKADGHERRIATYLVENLKTATDLETYTYLTQVVQAETMMFGYRGWRRQWGDERHCGGALLWQLNDCWPTISWAIVDYFLRPKPAFYAVARVLAPLAVGIRREHHDWSVTHAQPPKTSKFELWVVSSAQEQRTGTVELRFLSISDGQEVREKVVHENITIRPNGTTNLIVDGLIDYKEYPEPHVLAARLWVDGEIVARDVDWPQPFKYLDFAERGLVVEKVSEMAEQQTLKISAQKPVKCLVFEERDGVKISDSAMDIIPGDDQTVTVRGVKAGDSLKYKYLDH